LLQTATNKLAIFVISTHSMFTQIGANVYLIHFIANFAKWNKNDCIHGSKGLRDIWELKTDMDWQMVANISHFYEQSVTFVTWPTLLNIDLSGL